MCVCVCVCVYVSLWCLWCVNDFHTAGSKMTLRPSLHPGGVQLSLKYEQRQCFTLSNVVVTLGKVIKFQVEKISFWGFCFKVFVCK
jgi:hypothetical protein